jgi:hypothetical protein
MLEIGVQGVSGMETNGSVGNDNTAWRHERGRRRRSTLNARESEDAACRDRFFAAVADGSMWKVAVSPTDTPASRIAAWLTPTQNPPPATSIVLPMNGFPFNDPVTRI